MTRKTALLPILTFVFDIFFIVLSYLFSFWIRFSSGILPISKGIPTLQSYFLSLIFIVLSYLTIFNLFFLYQKGKLFDEYYKIFKSTLIVFFIFMTFTFIQREISYSRLFIFISFISSFLFVSFGRFFISSFKRSLYCRGRLLTSVLLICDKQQSALFQRSINKNEGYFIHAILTPSQLKQLPEFIRLYAVEEVIIHLPREDYVKIHEIMDLGGYDVIYRIIPQTSDILTKKLILGQIYNLTVFTISETPLKGVNRLIKRFFDLLFSCFALFFLSPLFFIVALLIKLNSKGHVFYVQERISYNNKPFKIYKFRTMIQNAEKHTGPKWADNDDKRIFSFGKFLRKTNFDELPQLFNVLKGDMSLVGPRPERPHFIHQFRNSIPRYIERHAVKGGMTGWAQVNGYYGNTPLGERTQYDVFYIENWSLFFDIKILLKTVKLLFFRRR